MEKSWKSHGILGQQVCTNPGKQKSLFIWNLHYISVIITEVRRKSWKLLAALDKIEFLYLKTKDDLIYNNFYSQPLLNIQPSFLKTGITKCNKNSVFLLKRNCDKGVISEAFVPWCISQIYTAFFFSVITWRWFRIIVTSFFSVSYYNRKSWNDTFVQYTISIVYFLGNFFTTSLKAPIMWQITILSSKSESRLPQPKCKHFPFITLYNFFLVRCIFMSACFNTKKHDCEDYQPSAVFLCTKCKGSYDTVTRSQ